MRQLSGIAVLDLMVHAGLYDPWHLGGVLHDLSETVKVCHARRCELPAADPRLLAP